jgi:DNA-binding transcriptional regulator YhcF (GntR family)
LKGQFALDRYRAEPLSLQIVRQVQEAIEAGRVARGTRLPSTRLLARTLGVSRNTVLTAYEELAAPGLRSRPPRFRCVRVRAHRGLWLQPEIRHA